MRFRTVGPEYQGLQERAKLWIPQTYGDLWQAHLLYFRTLIDETSTWPMAMRPHVCSALLEAVEHQIRIPPCTELAFEILEKLSSDSAMDPSKLNRFFWHWQEYREDEGSRETAGRLRRLARRFARRNLASRFQRYVLDVDWLEWEENYRRQSDKQHSHAKALVGALARRVAAKPDLLEEISHLLAPDSNTPAIWHFGEQLGASDRAENLLPLLTRISLKSAHGTCLHGYLTGLKARSLERFESWLMEMLRTRDTASLGAEMALRSTYCEKVFCRCLDALEAGWIDPGKFGAMRYGRAMDAVPREQAERMLRLIRERATPQALRLVVELLDSTDSVDLASCGPDFVFTVARDTIPSSRHPQKSSNFHWKRVCSSLVKSNAAFAAPLLESILTAIGEEYEVSYDSSVGELSMELVSTDPEKSWEVIAKQFEATLPKWRSDLFTWLKGTIHSFDDGTELGPIAHLPENSILKWIDADPSERAALIAHAALPTLDDDGGGSLTRHLLTRYSHIEGVQSGISASFHTGSWSGPASLYLKRKRDVLRQWLTKGFDPQVAQWIEQEIEQHDREIEREEINEERDRFE